MGVIPLVRFFPRFVTKIVGRVAYVGILKTENWYS